eukprot:gene1836-1116_t
MGTKDRGQVVRPVYSPPIANNNINSTSTSGRDCRAAECKEPNTWKVYILDGGEKSWRPTPSVAWAAIIQRRIFFFPHALNKFTTFLGSFVFFFCFIILFFTPTLTLTSAYTTLPRDDAPPPRPSMAEELDAGLPRCNSQPALALSPGPTHTHCCNNSGSGVRVVLRLKPQLKRAPKTYLQYSIQPVDTGSSTSPSASSGCGCGAGFLGLLEDPNGSRPPLPLPPPAAAASLFASAKPFHAHTAAAAAAALKAAAPGFTFDHILDVSDSDESVCAEMVPPLLHRTRHGIHSTVLLHGPSGAGKTHTLNVLAPALAQALFTSVLRPDADLLELSYVQVYEDQAYHLVGPSGTTPLGTPLPVSPPLLPRVVVRTVEEVQEKLKRAESFKCTASDALNARSSCSDCILAFTVTRCWKGALVSSTRVTIVDLSCRISARLMVQKQQQQQQRSLHPFPCSAAAYLHDFHQYLSALHSGAEGAALLALEAAAHCCPVLTALLGPVLHAEKAALTIFLCTCLEVPTLQETVELLRFGSDMRSPAPLLHHRNANADARPGPTSPCASSPSASSAARQQPSPFSFPLDTGELQTTLDVISRDLDRANCSAAMERLLRATAPPTLETLLGSSGWYGGAAADRGAPPAGAAPAAGLEHGSAALQLRTGSPLLTAAAAFTQACSSASAQPPAADPAAAGPGLMGSSHIPGTAAAVGGDRLQALERQAALLQSAKQHLQEELHRRSQQSAEPLDPYLSLLHERGRMYELLQHCQAALLSRSTSAAAAAGSTCAGHLEEISSFLLRCTAELEAARETGLVHRLRLHAVRLEVERVEEQLLQHGQALVQANTAMCRQLATQQALQEHREALLARLDGMEAELYRERAGQAVRQDTLLLFHRKQSLHVQERKALQREAALHRRAAAALQQRLTAVEREMDACLQQRSAVESAAQRRDEAFRAVWKLLTPHQKARFNDYGNTAATAPAVSSASGSGSGVSAANRSFLGATSGGSLAQGHELVVLSAQLKEAERELEQERMCGSERDSAIAELKEEVRRLVSGIGRRDTRLSRLQAELAGLQVHVRDLETQLVEAVVHSHRQVERLRATKEEVRLLRECRQRLEGERDDYRDESMRLNQLVVSLRHDVEERADEICLLTRHIQHINAERAQQNFHRQLYYESRIKELEKQLVLLEKKSGKSQAKRAAAAAAAGAGEPPPASPVLRSAGGFVPRLHLAGGSRLDRTRRRMRSAMPLRRGHLASFSGSTAGLSAALGGGTAGAAASALPITRLFTARQRNRSETRGRKRVMIASRPQAGRRSASGGAAVAAVIPSSSSGSAIHPAAAAALPGGVGAAAPLSHHPVAAAGLLSAGSTPMEGSSGVNSPSERQRHPGATNCVAGGGPPNSVRISRSGPGAAVFCILRSIFSLLSVVCLWLSMYLSYAMWCGVCTGEQPIRTFAPSPSLIPDLIY